MGLVSEFKEFINKGNVVDLAVAVVLGAAFQQIVNSVVDDIIMPIIAALGGLDDIAKLKWHAFTYGKLLAAVIKFFLVAMVLFAIVKMMNRVQKKDKA